MHLAIQEAHKFFGATVPNPPVGACLVKGEKILALGAHEKAGNSHAEIAVLEKALKSYGSEGIRQSTLYVTLEPCNHYGKTPPCTKAILESGVTRVVYGVIDPNPTVQGKAKACLQQAGISVTYGVLEKACSQLIEPYKKWITTGLPWIVHKMAFRITKNSQITMLPEPGQKTFCSLDTMKQVHLERKKSDAILTSLATISHDWPEFTVRHIQDYPQKKRWIALLSRSKSTPPPQWKERQEGLGFQILQATQVEEALSLLGTQGVHRVLVECGPTLSQTIISKNIWDERLIFVHWDDGTQNDIGFLEKACLQELSAL